KNADELNWRGEMTSLTTVADASRVLGPDAKTLGTLTEPREFNLMFETYHGALRDEANKGFLRPETAQGIFVNFKNVLHSTRVRRAGRDRPSRRFRPAQPHGGEARQSQWQAGGRTGLGRQAQVERERPGPDLPRRAHQRALHAARDRAFGRRGPGHAGLSVR